MKNSKQIKGAIHLHTTLSHDGTLSLDQLTGFLREHSYQFLAITEHSYDIDYANMINLANNCEKLSSEEFLVIPGIEYRCHDDIDILGFGVIKPCNSDDPIAIINHIHENDGVAVLAHPTIRNYPMEEEWVKLLDGVEFWNVQEGKYFPQARTVRKFRQLHKWQPKLWAFCGLDLHRLTSFYPIFAVVDVDQGSKADILRAFKEGRFFSRSPIFNVGSTGKLGIVSFLYMLVGSSTLNLLRAVRDFVKK